MRYQQTNERRAVILMVVLSLLTLFALVGVTFVLYADAEATAARVAREAQTIQTAEVNPQEALAYFLGQLIYDVPDAGTGTGSGLRGHSLARTMYGYNYTVPATSILNTVPFNGIGRLHYASGSLLPYPVASPTIVTPLRNVPNNYISVIDDYALVNYTWFSSDNFVRDPERVGIRANPTVVQANPYVGCNAPYTYPDLNSFFLAAMRADGTVLTPSYHRPWLFQVATLNAGGVPTPKFYAFNDMTNPNWTSPMPMGKYLTLRPRPAEHPAFPLPGDATGDVKNLPWAPGGNDSIWVDLGAPVMTAPDGTQYKMMFAPLILDLDGRINLNTAGNLSAYLTAMTTPLASWQQASYAHVSNQGWGPWEVNLSKVLWGEQAGWVSSTLPTPPEWMRLLTGASYVVPTPPNKVPIVQPGILPNPLPIPNANLSAWLLPGVGGRYLETVGPLWTPNAPPASILPAFPYAISMATNYSHPYAQTDYNGLGEGSIVAPYLSNRAAPPGFGGVATACYPTFSVGYGNGGVPNGIANVVSVEDTNNAALYNAFQSPFTSNVGTRAFRAQDMEPLLRANASASGSVDTNASAVNSDLLRLCPTNFPSETVVSALTGTAKLMAQRYRNMVTTQSSDLGAPGVIPYWYSPGYFSTEFPVTAYPFGYYLYPPAGAAAAFPPPPTSTTPSLAQPSEFGLDWRASSANSSVYSAFSNPAGYTSPGARIRLNRPLPPYPHMAAGVTPPYQTQPPQPPPVATATPSTYGQAYNLTNNVVIANQFAAAQNARQALANDIYRRLLAITGLTPPLNKTLPTNIELAPYRWLAQLAVNIVDYIDEDDIMTPFNFYTTVDGLPATSIYTTQGGDDPGTNANNYPGVNNATGPNLLYWVYGTEMPKVVINEVLAEAQQLNIANPVQSGEKVKVWVELYNTMPTMWPALGGTNTQPQDSYRVPLYMTNPGGTDYSPYRISITQYTMEQSTIPLSAPGTTNNQLADVSQNVLGKAYVAGPFPQSTTDSDFANVIQLSGNLANPAQAPTMQAAFPPATAPIAGVPLPVSVNAGVDPGNYFLVGPTADTTNYPSDPFVFPGLPAGVPVLKTPNMTYTPTWTAGNSNDERSTGLTVLLRRLANPYLPPQPNPAVLTSPYNPYVTVDSIPSVALQTSKNVAVSSFGKQQPYAGLLLLASKVVYNAANGTATIVLSSNSPVTQQITNPKPPPQGAVVTPVGGTVTNTFGLPNFPLPPSGHYDWLVHLDRAPISPMELLHVSAWPPYKLTQRFMLGSDSNPTINVSAASANPSPGYTIENGNWKYMYPLPPTTPPYSPPPPTPPYPAAINMVNMFAHYAPWFDLPPLSPTTTPPNIANANLPYMSCPWWFDDGTSGLMNPVGQSHRLYRLFEFLECGDRAFGVNGLGRIAGKVNINTIWDPEILQALIDANSSMGTTTNLPYAPVNVSSGLPWTPAPADLVSQIFANMLNSRSPNYYGNGAYVAAGTQANGSALPPIGPVNMGTLTAVTGFDDRPFMPLSTGLYAPTTAVTTATAAAQAQLTPSQFPNGFSILTDTILRTNNPPETAASTNTYPVITAGTSALNQYLLFQNYYDNGTGVSGTTPVTSAVHPYLQTQLLNKLYNNVTTRSNTFAVFLTVGFFQVIPGGAVGQPSIPQLGPEIGRSEGKHVRHRMFAIVDRTNLTTFATTGQGYAPPTAPPPVTGPTPNALYAATVSVPPAPSPNPTGAQTIQLPLTVTGAILPGPPPTPQLYVPNPLTGISGVIQAGTQLVIDPGTVNEETVTVISVTPPTPTTPALLLANFTLPHGAGGLPFPIVQRGNPGPWLLTPYDPRLDNSVVPYFSIID